MKWLKRILISSTFAGTLSVLLIGVVLATVFTASITITNTSATSYTYIPLSASNNNTYLATQGYILATGTDVQLYQSSTALKRMLVSDRTNFVLPSLSAYGSAMVSYTTNNSPSNFSIISGYNGYFTVIDDIDLEMGNNGSMNMTTAYLDTASQLYANPTIRAETTGFGTNTIVPVTMPAGFASGDLLIMYVNAGDVAGLANPAITTPAGWTLASYTSYGTDETLGCYYKTSNGAEASPTNVTVDRNSYYSFKCMAITKGTWGGLSIGVPATGLVSNPDPPNLVTTYPSTIMWIAYCAGRADQASAPVSYSNFKTGGANSSYTSTAEKVNTTSTENPGTFGTSVQYWAANTLAISGSISKYYYKHYDNTAGGVMCYPDSSTSGKVHLFVDNGAGSTADVSLTGITTGEYSSFITSLSGGTLTLTIGSSTNTTAWAGTIGDSTDLWYFGVGNTLPYVDSIRETVAGTLELNFAPTTIIIGTTLPDREATGGSNDGTFTWGINPAGVTVTMSGMTFSSAVSSGTSLTTPNVVGTAGSGIPQIHRPNTDLTMPGNELYPTVNTIATLANIPIVMIWWFGSFICVIIVLGVVKKYSNSIFAAGIMAVIVMGVFCVLGASPTVPNSGGCLEFWQPASVLLAVIAQSVMDKAYMM